jgi:outer membrane protein assembly factor BamB
MVVIDLGEEFSSRVSEPRGRRPRHHNGAVRSTALVVVLVLALLGGAQSPVPPKFAAVATVSIQAPSAVLLTGDTLYIGEDSGGVRTVSAYTVPGGGVRWRVPLADAVRGIRRIADAGVLLATTYGTTMGTGRLAALDADTGRLLWSELSTTVVDAPAGGRVLLERQAMSGPVELRWIDVRTGRVAWSRTAAPGADVSARPGSGGLLVTDPDGSATLVAEETGSVLASGELGSLVDNIVLTPGPPGGRPNPSAQRVMVTAPGDGFLVQRRRNAGSGSLTAFDSDTLTERWSITGDLLGLPVRCGSLLCLGAVGGLRAIDPITGEVRWSTPRWQYASTLDEERLIGYALGSAADGIGVLDARTGRTLRDLRPEATRVFPTGTQRPLLGRPDSAHRDRYWFSELDVDPATVRPLGSLTGIDWQTCQAAGNLLACQTLDQRLRVWRHGG